MVPLTAAAKAMRGTSEFAQTVKTGFTNVIRNRVFQVVFVVLLVLGVVYYLGGQSQREKAKYDEVDTSKLPSKDDKIDNITREQADEAVKQCKFYFDSFGLMVYDAVGNKTAFMRKLLALSEYELGTINNLYNARYVPAGGENLYTEIENDWGIGELSNLQDQLLAKLRKIGAGKKAK